MHLFNSVCEYAPICTPEHSAKIAALLCNEARVKEKSQVFEQAAGFGTEPLLLDDTAACSFVSVCPNLCFFTSLINLVKTHSPRHNTLIKIATSTENRVHQET